MEIYVLQSNEKKAWDEYVLNHADSTFYHQFGWRNVVEGSYGHKPCYLVAKEDDRIKGILPLFLMKNVIFGKKLVSVPFGPYGGVCADNETITDALIQEAIRFTNECGADYLEVRTGTENNKSCLISESFYVTSILELGDPEIVWKDKLTRNKRKTISKSEKQDLAMEWTNNSDDFYNMFSHNMRDLGSPVHSKKFFENILHEFPTNSKVLVVKHNGTTIYAAFYLLYKDTIINSWSSTLGKYRKYYPTDFGIWNAIKYGCNEGYKYYDFGRSQNDSSNLEFKRRWSAEPKKLCYHYHLNNITKIPNSTSKNPNRQKFATIWKKLPLTVTNKVGPFLRTNVP